MLWYFYCNVVKYCIVDNIKMHGTFIGLTYKTGWISSNMLVCDLNLPVRILILALSNLKWSCSSLCQLSFQFVCSHPGNLFSTK